MFGSKRLGALCALLSLFVGAASAQDYPNRPIRLIVPYTAGGPADIAARLVADQLTQQLAQPIIIDNRPGAGGVVGTQAGATAAPDGYTLALTGNNIAIAQAIATSSPGYDSVTSFTHLGQIAVLPSGLFVLASSRFSSLEDLLRAARERRGELTYGTGGIGSPSHFAMELLLRRSGLQIQHIPYRGTAQALADVLGGRVDMLFTSIAGPMDQVRAGQLRLLALSSPERLRDLPDVPALAETFPGYAAETWLGISAPAGLPPAVASRLSAEIERAVNNPALATRMAATGLTARALAGEGMTTKMREELASNVQIAREANVRPE